MILGRPLRLYWGAARTVRATAAAVGPGAARRKGPGAARTALGHRCRRHGAQGGGGSAGRAAGGGGGEGGEGPKEEQGQVCRTSPKRAVVKGSRC